MRLKLLAAWSKLHALVFGLVGTVAMLNGAVAIAAFVKDVLIATYLGTSTYADAFTLAYFIPDTLGCNLLAASIGMSCVPIFARLFAQGRMERLWEHARAVLALTQLLAAVLTVLLYVTAPLVANLTGSPELRMTVVPLMRIMMPLIIVAPLLYIGFSLLQSLGHFAVPAGSWMILHTAVIIVLAIGLLLRVSPAQSVYSISAAVTLGFAAMAALTWRHIYRKSTIRMTWGTVNWRSGELHEIGVSFVSYLVILSSTQLIYFIERLLATHADVGTVTGLNYAFRLSQLPITVFTLAISSVVLPSMSQDIALNKQQRLQNTVIKALTDILIVSLPATLLLFLLRVPIVSVLFERGAFDSSSVRITAEMLKGYSLTISGLSISAVCLRYFLAAQKVRVPLIVCLIAAAANAAADVYLNATIGAVGLAYGAFIGSLLNGGALLVMLARERQLSYTMLLRSVPKVIAANIPLFCIGWFGSYLWFHGADGASFVIRASFLFILLGLAAIAYWLGMRKLNLIRF